MTNYQMFGNYFEEHRDIKFLANTTR